MNLSENEKSHQNHHSDIQITQLFEEEEFEDVDKAIWTEDELRRIDTISQDCSIKPKLNNNYHPSESPFPVHLHRNDKTEGMTYYENLFRSGKKER
jgi:hypothetical protein